jgi:hypothetical protein
MPFKEFLTEARLDAAVTAFNFPLFEAINSYMAKAVAALDARPEGDHGAAGVDIIGLTNMLTTFKVISNRELRSSITKDDVGFDPNDVNDLFNVLNKVPDSPKAKLPSDVDKFFKDVAGLASKIKKGELTNVKGLVSSDEAERKKSIAYLKQYSTKVDQLYNKLKTAKG